MERISFDEKSRTFRLYPGNSLYAFCISPKLSLEHLYWGKNLRGGFDLRPLLERSRLLHFSTSEKLSVLYDEIAEDVKESWKIFKFNERVLSDSAIETRSRRLENLSWRLVGQEIKSIEQAHSKTNPYPPISYKFMNIINPSCQQKEQAGFSGLSFQFLCLTI